MEAGNAAATLILNPREFTEEMWDDMLNYAEEVFPQKYGDLDLDEIDSLNKRKLATEILRNLLPNDSAIQRVQILARKWQTLRQEKRKRTTAQDDEVIALDRRQKEEQMLRKNINPTLPSCNRSAFSMQNTLPKVMADSSLPGFTILLPYNDFERFQSQNRFERTFAEISSSAGKVFARVTGGLPPQHSGMIHVSPSVNNYIEGPALVKFCDGGLPLTQVMLRFYGTVSEFNSESVVPEDFKNVLEQMPMISRGQTITSGKYTMRVQQLFSGDSEVFSAQIPRDADVVFGFDAETSANVGCNLCGKASRQMYCSEKCAYNASMMICASCGQKASHACGGCRGVPYCSKKCQAIGWQNDQHETLCRIGKNAPGAMPKRKLNFDDPQGVERDEERTQRRRAQPPPDYMLPNQMRQRINNPRFLTNYIREHGLDYIRQVVAQSYEGLEGALNQNNLFWYFVYREIMRNQPFDPYTNYRDVVFT